MTIPTSWSNAGLTDEDGVLERVTAWREWSAPDVSLDDDRITWSLKGQSRPVRATAKLLEEFVRLGDASSDQIVRYARHWGTLGICRHGLPASHNPGPTPRPMLLGPLEKLPWCRVQGFWEGHPWELIETWRAYARKFHAILDAAAHIHLGVAVEARCWRELNIDRPDWSPLVAERRLEERQQLRVVLNQLIDQAGISLELEWSGSKPTLTPAGSGLFGALVIQAILAVARSDGLALCSSCAAFYIPPRRPRSGERRYCADCQGGPATRCRGSLPSAATQRSRYVRRPEPRLRSGVARQR